MDLRYTDEEAAFRDELRDWLADAVPAAGSAPDEDDWAATRAYDAAWQRTLFDAGYAGINWPKEYGGRGASPVEHLIFLEETERAGAPYVGTNFVGLLHAGPTIMTEASEAQKQFHLPPILKGEHVLVPGLLRAPGRLGPGQPAHPGGAGRRRVRHQRPEDLDQPRPRGRLLRDAGAHRPRRPQAPGHLLGDRPHGHAGHRHPAAGDHPGRGRVQRGVLRRRAGAGGQPGGRRERRLAGGHGDLQLRAGHRVRQRDARLDAAGGRPGRLRQGQSPATAPRPGTTAACAGRSATWRPSWTRCGP